MDGGGFDRLARTLAGGATRRWLVRSLASVSAAGLLGSLMEREDAAADGRRRRRKKRHKHGKGRHKENRKGRRGGKRQKGKREDPATPCQPEPLDTTCADACGSVDNNCGEEVDCGPCGCPAGETACGDQCYVPSSDCVYCEHEGGGGVCLWGIRSCVENHVQCGPESSSELERCDGVDNDGDGLTDEGSLCPGAPHATSACVDGGCILTCDEGFGDCDGNPENGCETDLQTNPHHCGTCGGECRCSDGAIAVCSGGVCVGCGGVLG